MERDDRWRLQPITGYSIATLSIGTNKPRWAGDGDNYKDQVMRTRKLWLPLTLKTDNIYLARLNNSLESSASDTIMCHYGHCLSSLGLSTINVF